MDGSYGFTAFAITNNMETAAGGLTMPRMRLTTFSLRVTRTPPGAQLRFYMKPPDRPDHHTPQQPTRPKNNNKNYDVKKRGILGGYGILVRRNCSLVSVNLHTACRLVDAEHRFLVPRKTGGCVPFPCPSFRREGRRAGRRVIVDLFIVFG